MNYILTRLWLWFMFAGTTFFASGAIANAEPMGGFEAGNEGGIEDTGGEPASVDEGEPGGSAGEAEASEVLDPTEKQDNRTLPKNVQSALKTFKEAHPELAKEIDELRKSYFGHRQHSEFFKSPSEARQAKATLDLVGGSEGITKLQQQVAAVEAVDSAFEQGDSSVIDDVSSDYPEGFKKLIPYALEKLQSMDAQAFAKVVQPHQFALLEHAGLGSVAQAILEAVSAQAPDLNRIKDLAQRTLQWYEGQKQQAGQRPKGDDPERLKFQQEQQKFRTEQEQAFRQDIGRETLSHQKAEIEKVLNADPRFRKLSADAKTDLVAGVKSEMEARLKADQTYQGQMKAFLSSKTRDRSQIISYVNSTVSDVVKKAGPAVLTRRYGTVRPAAQPQNGQRPQANAQRPANPASSAPVKLTAKPNRTDVDWSRTKDILFITNKAYMKNGPYKGKLVTW